jgi:hypothetical protein
MNPQQTNRDFIADRLNARMNQFMYQPPKPHQNHGSVENINSVDRLGNVTQRRHNLQMNDYLTNHPAHAVNHLPDIDLRKPLNFTVLSDETTTPSVSDRNSETSEQMNIRYQQFTPISANRAYPLQSKNFCPIENKPEDTRQHGFKK